MNITITGNLGAGKTSVCSCLKEQGVEIISTGKIFREVAAEKGLTVLEMNELAKTDRSVDALIDKRSADLGRELDGVVFDSRMAWHFIPQSFKVFLLADVTRAAARVFADHTRDTEKYTSLEDAEKSLLERAVLERERFLDLYGVDYLSMDNYNLIIDSTGATPKQVADEILRCFALYQEKPYTKRVELCISNLYPTQSFEEADPKALQEYVDAEKACAGLCASEAVSVVQENGYVYMAGGQFPAFAAAHTGKVFVEALPTDGSGCTMTAFSKTGLNAFEDFGGFRYEYYPDETPKRPGYFFDFTSNLSH